jgi:hypothetical protein
MNSTPAAEFFSRITPQMDRSKIQPDEKISELLQEKLNDFIRELKLDPARFIFLKSSSRLSSASARGTLREQCSGIILLNPEFVEELERDFNDMHKFIIAHEISHLLNDDFAGEYDRYAQISKVHVLAYCAAMAATTFFFSYPVAHVASIGAAAAIKEMRWRQLKRPTESNADLWAASQSQNLARGGVQYFTKMLEDLSAVRDQQLQFLDKAKKETKSGLKACLLSIPRLLIRVFRSERLVNLCDPDHPALRDRIAAIKEMIHKNQD